MIISSLQKKVWYLRWAFLRKCFFSSCDRCLLFVFYLYVTGFWVNRFNKLGYFLSARSTLVFFFKFFNYHIFQQHLFSVVFFFFLDEMSLYYWPTLVAPVTLAVPPKMRISVFVTVNVHILTLKNKIWLTQILLFINCFFYDR